MASARLKRSVYQHRQTRDADRIDKGRADNAKHADLLRFDAWPGVRGRWLTLLGQQSYHRARMASDAVYAERYAALCELQGIKS